MLCGTWVLAWALGRSPSLFSDHGFPSYKWLIPMWYTFDRKSFTNYNKFSLWILNLLELDPFVKGPLYFRSFVKDYYALGGLTMHWAGPIKSRFSGLIHWTGLGGLLGPMWLIHEPISIKFKSKFLEFFF